MHRVSRFIFAVFASATLLVSPAIAADPLPAPEGDVLLTITGAIGLTNNPEGDAALFDRAMLEALPVRTIRTATIWTEGVQEFTGVPLADLLERIEVTDRPSLRAAAINDYAIDIPAEDWENDVALIAYERNGAEMSVRDKGPLWVIYPFDDAPELNTEVHFSRSIWQLDRIEIKE
ncbi:molybdopterin-dependent oxidoreductase [Litorisediminicola beolgyonensis]|uniref:Molybdopterin-dependent oxidoreductase n=1 Tax=Litorisediminicola beolgyonensis TaxID=1173614 RepID=A0ABW3ZLC4_9RHOB